MKNCFKCQRLLPISEFYGHPRMADGHLNKCKDCTRKDVKENEQRLRKDPNWVIKERGRCRKKSQRRRAEGRQRVNAEAKKLAQTKYRHKYPEKAAARLKTARARLVKQPCAICGNSKVEAHHEDYSRPLDVTWLCSKHHAARHVELRAQEIRQRLGQT